MDWTRTDEFGADGHPKHAEHGTATASDMLGAVESVHRDDSYGARDGYRSPYVLEEDYAAWDEARLERICEHAPAHCLDCRQLADWMIW